jgi:hypothetical protein
MIFRELPTGYINFLQDFTWSKSSVALARNGGMSGRHFPGKGFGGGKPDN